MEGQVRPRVEACRGEGLPALTQLTEGGTCCRRRELPPVLLSTLSDTAKDDKADDQETKVTKRAPATGPGASRDPLHPTLLTTHGICECQEGTSYREYG